MTKNNYPLTGRTLDRNETKQAREYKEQENELVPGLPHATWGVSVFCSLSLAKGGSSCYALSLARAAANEEWRSG